MEKKIKMPYQAQNLTVEIIPTQIKTIYQKKNPIQTQKVIKRVNEIEIFSDEIKVAKL